MLAHLSTQPDLPYNMVTSGTFDPNATRTNLDAGSITTELRDTKLTFEMGSHLNEATTMGALDGQKEASLKVPSSTRVSKRSSSNAIGDAASQKSFPNSINASSFDGTRGKSKIDPEPEYRRQKIEISKAAAK